MKITLLFFGSLSDILENQDFELEENSTLATLIDKLSINQPLLNGYKYKVAINQKMIEDEVELREGDEIAFLPPFAGG